MLIKSFPILDIHYLYIFVHHYKYGYNIHIYIGEQKLYRLNYTYYICIIEYYIVVINIYLILDFINTYEIIKIRASVSLIKMFINYFYMSCIFLFVHFPVRYIKSWCLIRYLKIKWITSFQRMREYYINHEYRELYLTVVFNLTQIIYRHILPLLLKRLTGHFSSASFLFRRCQSSALIRPYPFQTRVAVTVSSTFFPALFL